MKATFFVTTILVLTTISQFSIADDENGKMKFEERKAKVLENISKRKTNLDRHESCVKSATDGEALKSCMKAQKELMKSLRSERKR